MSRLEWFVFGGCSLVVAFAFSLSRAQACEGPVIEVHGKMLAHPLAPVVYRKPGPVRLCLLRCVFQSAAVPSPAGLWAYRETGASCDPAPCGVRYPWGKGSLCLR